MGVYSSGFSLHDVVFLVRALVVTIQLSLASLLVGSTIGFIVGVLRSLRVRMLDGFLGFMIDVVRGTPLVFQILLGYYGLAALGVSMSPFGSALLVLGTRAAAQIAEIVMASILSVDQGQWLASRSLGMTFLQLMWHVILPQAVVVALPSYAGTLTMIVKDSSAASIVGFVELTRAAAIITARTYRALLVFGFASLLYFVVCYALSRLSLRLERELSKT